MFLSQISNKENLLQLYVVLGQVINDKREKNNIQQPALGEGKQIQAALRSFSPISIKEHTFKCLKLFG